MNYFMNSQINYRLETPDVTICSSNQSASANRIFMENHYPPYNVCHRPCTDMRLQLTLLGRIKDKENIVKFTLFTEIEKSSEIQAKSAMNLLAQLRGYLGLTLGVFFDGSEEDCIIL